MVAMYLGAGLLLKDHICISEFWVGRRAYVCLQYYAVQQSVIRSKSVTSVLVF